LSQLRLRDGGRLCQWRPPSRHRAAAAATATAAARRQSRPAAPAADTHGSGFSLDAKFCAREHK